MDEINASRRMDYVEGLNLQGAFLFAFLSPFCIQIGAALGIAALFVRRRSSIAAIVALRE
jgi:hypothetical protein